MMRLPLRPLSLLLLSLLVVVLPLCASRKSEKVFIQEKGSLASDWESLFLQQPTSSGAYEHLAFYTSLPHVAGTPGDYETVLYTQKKFQEYGLPNVRIDPHLVTLNYPLQRTVEIVDPPNLRFRAKLAEDYIPLDPTSSDPRIIPTFNGYSPSGDATGLLVYANYGTFEDFELLENKYGISVSGKIVIVRYGSIFRGTKAMIAEQRGAKAVLIYSDPADDGYVKGPVIPNGPYRPESGVQRGSVAYLSLCPGDPTRAACGNSSQNFIPLIPVQPISWGDAYPLLSALTGPAAPSEWNGGLNFTYHLGPGPITVHVNTQMNFTTTPIWNVVSEIQGENPNELVIIGNHRDAWVFGAVDPNSGTAALLEIARGFGTLLKKGWKPKRSILLCSWDGEEYGLLGSTAFADANAADLSKRAAVYFNVDVGVAGQGAFYISATPSLRSFAINVTKSVTDPLTGKPIHDIWNQVVPVLGSGSDYTAFLDHLGIPSSDMGFQSGHGGYGTYHSIFDSMYFMSHFGDPTFQYHQAIAQLWGLMALRFADSLIVPFNFSDYGVSLDEFSAKIYKLRKEYGGDSHLDLSPIDSAITQFHNATAILQSALSPKRLLDMDKATLSGLNSQLILAERLFLGPGLPKRPYYKHTIQAPGLYLGYGADAFPGVAQSIRDHDWTTGKQEVTNLATAISNVAHFLASISK